MQRGLIVVTPPHLPSRTNPKIALETENPDIYKLFNQAASIVTKEFKGFQQVGSENQEGFTAWEHWSKPETYSQVIDQIYKEMRKIKS